jgi:HSP20 family molecular chaperone IbpA
MTPQSKQNVPARSTQQDIGMPTWWDRFWAWPNFPQMRRFFEEDDMRVEEFVDDDKLVVRAEIPGIDPDRDVEVDVQDHSLRIRAERRAERHADEGVATTPSSTTARSLASCRWRARSASRT